MKVGFIGVGSMGSVMVPNLVKADHEVAVWNRNADEAKKLEGVSVLSSVRDAFQNEAVITMLSDDDAVRSVIVEGRPFASAKTGCVHVMMATISPALSSELSELHQHAGVRYVAATVFGIPSVAAKGELNIVTAGDAEALATVEPLFEALCQKTWPVGTEPYRANVAKIAGNLMITLAIEAMGEATALTESYGLKAGDFLEIVTNTMFACPSYKRYGENISNEVYEPGFKLPLGLKDVNLALDAAQAKNINLPSAEIVRANMQTGVDQGINDKDWSALAKVAQERAGLDKRVA